jgi:hypothetical protein
MARLYANENFPVPVVESLREAGHDVITVAETGKAEQSWPDEDVLEFAIQDDRVLLTLNRKHFIRLHKLRPRSCGYHFLHVRSRFRGPSREDLRGDWIDNRFSGRTLSSES